MLVFDFSAFAGRRAPLPMRTVQEHRSPRKPSHPERVERQSRLDIGGQTDAAKYNRESSDGKDAPVLLWSLEAVAKEEVQLVAQALLLLDGFRRESPDKK